MDQASGLGNVGVVIIIHHVAMLVCGGSHSTHTKHHWWFLYCFEVAVLVMSAFYQILFGLAV